MKYFMFAQALSAGSGNVATLIQILPLGEFKSGDGSVIFVTPESIDEIIARFDARQNDLVVDYEHQTLTGEEAPAAGWIKKLVKKEDGLWAEVQWTRRGEERIREKEYRYLSPVVLAKKKDSRGRLIPEALHSAALTNDPAIDGMVPLAAKDQFEIINREKVMEQFLEKLCKALGIDTKSDETQVVTAVAACKAKADKPLETKEVLPSAVVKALDLNESATVSEVEATILAMKQGAGKNKEVEEIKKELAEMKSEKLVCKALEAGKITADQKDWAQDYALRDPKGFEIFSAKAPQVVPMDKIPTAPETSAAFITEEVAELAGIFGNSKEDLVKFGGLKSAS